MIQYMPTGWLGLGFNHFLTEFRHFGVNRNRLQLNVQSVITKYSSNIKLYLCIWLMIEPCFCGFPCAHCILLYITVKEPFHALHIFGHGARNYIFYRQLGTHWVI